MEMIVILAAVAALVFAGLVLAFGRGRNPSLRLPHEQELEERGDELFRDFDRDLAGLLEQAAREPDARPAFPERLAAPDAPRPQGRLIIDHDPAEPGLTPGLAPGLAPGLTPGRPRPRETERDGETR